jgi:hypothetical protein
VAGRLHAEVVPGLETLRDRLFAYVSSTNPVSTLLAIGPSVGGYICKGTRGRAQAAELATRSYLPIIWDPALYERHIGVVDTPLTLFGDPRIDAVPTPRPAAYLSPSGFIPDDDADTLDAVIREGITYCDAATATSNPAPAFIVIPVTARWLAEPHLTYLVDRLQTAGKPIALALADRNNPMDVTGAVAGLLTLLAEVPDILLLRTDETAIAANANGALASALGSGTGGRHFVPPGSTGGGIPKDKSPSVLVPGTLSFTKGSYLEQVRSDDGLLNCPDPPCDVCAGAHLGRFGRPELTGEAIEHSYAIAAEIHARIIERHIELRPEAWRLEAERALDRLDELDKKTNRRWHRSVALKAWADSPELRPPR